MQHVVGRRLRSWISKKSLDVVHKATLGTTHLSSKVIDHTWPPLGLDLSSPLGTLTRHIFSSQSPNWLWVHSAGSAPVPGNSTAALGSWVAVPLGHCCPLPLRREKSERADPIYIMLGRMQWELQPSLEEAETYCKEKPGAEAGLQMSDLEGIFGVETERKKGTSHTTPGSS